MTIGSQPLREACHYGHMVDHPLPISTASASVRQSTIAANQSLLDGASDFRMSDYFGSGFGEMHCGAVEAAKVRHAIWFGPQHAGAIGRREFATDNGQSGGSELLR